MSVLSRKRAFEELRSNLELTGLQETTVATRQKNVRAAVASQLTVVADFLTGSYRRQTLIGPLKSADVDIVVVLDRRYRDGGARTVLELVKKALLTEYIRTPAISRNGQAVTIIFTDFVVDVVPAFVRPWWTWNDGFEICDSGTNSWITTDPKKHVELSATANRAHGGHLVPRIKQLKAWNRAVGGPLRMFHLEVLAWSIFGTSWLWKYTQSSDWASARYFFDKARTELKSPLADPSGTGSDVAAYLHGTALNSAVRKVSTAYERCTHAERCADGDDLAGMHKAYGQVFGEHYPV